MTSFLNRVRLMRGEDNGSVGCTTLHDFPYEVIRSRTTDELIAALVRDLERMNNTIATATQNTQRTASAFQNQIRRATAVWDEWDH